MRICICAFVYVYICLMKNKERTDSSIDLRVNLEFLC